MDGESFDRLSVAVHRLREKATRRGALGLLLGGSVAAITGLDAEDADAKRRRRNRNRNKHKNCKGAGGKCRSDNDCCSRNCFGNRCFSGGGGGGGGGRRCGGRRCPNGWDCCRVSGVNVCVPRNHPACFNNGFCPAGWHTCGFNGPIRNCCSPDTRCCHNDFCLNDFFDCNDFFSDSIRSESAPEVTEPIPVTEIEPDEFD